MKNYPKKLARAIEEIEAIGDKSQRDQNWKLLLDNLDYEWKQQVERDYNPFAPDWREQVNQWRQLSYTAKLPELESDPGAVKAYKDWDEVRRKELHEHVTQRFKPQLDAAKTKAAKGEVEDRIDAAVRDELKTIAFDARGRAKREELQKQIWQKMNPHPLLSDDE